MTRATLSLRRAGWPALLTLLAACATAASETPTPQSASFDHPGGWRDATSCVDICGATPGSPVERPPSVVCFSEDDPDCAAKTGEGDYDYLLLSQHWLPTVCAGLAEGYDTTLTHPAGARCRDDAPGGLKIHGLWPNYENGFPQCCGDAAPLDPALAAEWPEILRRWLTETWPEPTEAGFETAVCLAYNHEWQKHGTCFGPHTQLGARNYFGAGLKLAKRLESSTGAIDSWAGETHDLAELESVYDFRPRILCDARHPENLLEIHTCWDSKFQPRDCPAAEAFGPLVPCGEQVTLPN